MRARNPTGRRTWTQRLKKPGAPRPMKRRRWMMRMCIPSRSKFPTTKSMRKSPPQAGDEAGRASLRIAIHAASVESEAIEVIGVIATAGADVGAVAGAMSAAMIGAMTARGKARAASRVAMIAATSRAAMISAAMNRVVMTHAGMIAGPSVATSRVKTVVRRVAPASMTMPSGVNPPRRARLAQRKRRHRSAMNP